MSHATNKQWSLKHFQWHRSIGRRPNCRYPIEVCTKARLSTCNDCSDFDDLPGRQDRRSVWEKLAEQFPRKAWANKLNLQHKFFAMKLKECGSVNEHIRIMTELFNELAVIGDAVSKEDRVVHLLASLPESYDVLVTALKSQSESVPSGEL